jgi:hypothetical protein
MPAKKSSKQKRTDALSKAFTKNATLENYLKLRRAYPNVEIEVAIHGGIDPLLYMQKELNRYGISEKDVASIFDADHAAISKIALQLMEKIIEGRKLAKAGETHLVRRGLIIPDKLVDWIINCCLDALSWNDDLIIPRDLIILIRERLGGHDTEYIQGAKIYELKTNAALIAGQLKAQGINPTYKMLGKILGVAPSTVKRWYSPDEFQRETNTYAEWFDAKGNLIDFGIRKLRKK